MTTTGPAPTRRRPPTPGGLTRTEARDRALIAAELERVRARTLAIVDAHSDDVQRAQHSPLMSPLVWDLGHVANYEELWLLRAVDGRTAVDPALDDLYNAFEHPRWTRPSLPILGPDEARDYGRRIRADVLELLGRIELDDEAGDPLLLDGYVYGMVVQHEHQHAETLLATLQLMGEASSAPPGTSPAPRRPAVDVAALPATRTIDGGLTVVGTDDFPWAYDNEGGAHVVEVEPFRIDTFPVTVRAYLEFIADGGYDRPHLWQPDGWSWREEAQLSAPEFWRPEGDGAWSVLRFGERLDVSLLLDEPVQHVCFWEADAFARWAGKRLPTEIEWEKAAEGTPHPGVEATSRNHAVANLGQRHSGPSVVGAHPDGSSRWGVHQLFGDVWEWTSSPFGPWPGFRAWPYREYSEVFFADRYPVLKGGSWAADPVAVRTTFRNWDLPIRRQIFSGFRCAESA